MSTQAPLSAEAESVITSIAKALGVHPRMFRRMAEVARTRCGGRDDGGAFILETARARVARFPPHRRAAAKRALYDELRTHLVALDELLEKTATS